MKTNLILIFLFGTIALQAQYSYISDRRFFAPDDLVGYDFKPGMMEVPNESQKELNPGDYSFGITFNNLYVKGEGIEGVYNINNIQPVEYGFKLALMNARDARLQGHLKVIINKWRMVESLIFKRSPNEKEIIFYLKPVSTKLNDEENAWFTDRGELAIASTDSLWGKKIYPFLRLHKDANVQERLRMSDSTSVTFVEKITIEEKDSKKKKSKTEEVAATAVTAETATADSTATTAVDPDKKVKIIKEYSIVIRSIVRYEGSLPEDKTWTYTIKKINEKEDKAAGLQEERYLWEFTTDKNDKILLYLNGDHSVSTFEVGPKTYKVRGF